MLSNGFVSEEDAKLRVSSEWWTSRHVSELPLNVGSASIYRRVFIFVLYILIVCLTFDSND